MQAVPDITDQTAFAFVDHGSEDHAAQRSEKAAKARIKPKLPKFSLKIINTISGQMAPA